MIKKLIYLAVLISVITLFASSRGYAVKKTDFVGVWLFDEGSGESVKDAIGNAEKGKVINGKWVSGKYGKALEFSGIGESYVSVPHNDSMNQEIFTVAAWINVPASSGWQTILAKDAMDIGAEELRTYGMFVISGQTGIHYSFKDKSKSHHTMNGKGTAADGKWHHVAMTYDSKTLRGYLDGALDAEQAFAGPPIMHNGALNIGGEINGRYNMKGSVDEVCILKVVLDENGIKDLMKGLSEIMAIELSGKIAATWANLKTR